MARTKGSKDKQPRRKRSDMNDVNRMREIISELDKKIHENNRDFTRMQGMLRDRDDEINRIRQEVTLEGMKGNPIKDGFDLAVTIMNTTRHTLKQLARQCAKEKNPIMASVFEFLYLDMANLDKYKRLMQKHDAGLDNMVDAVPPIVFPGVGVYTPGEKK